MMSLSLSLSLLFSVLFQLRQDKDGHLFRRSFYRAVDIATYHMYTWGRQAGSEAEREAGVGVEARGRRSRGN